MNNNDWQQRKTPCIKIARIFNFPHKKIDLKKLYARTKMFEEGDIK